LIYLSQLLVGWGESANGKELALGSTLFTSTERTRLFVLVGLEVVVMNMLWVELTLARVRILVIPTVWNYVPASL